MGRSSQGQLGCQRADKVKLPLEVDIELAENEKVTQIEAGSMYSMALITTTQDWINDLPRVNFKILKLFQWYFLLNKNFFYK